MKNLNKTLAVAAAVLVFASCEKDDVVDNSSLTSQIEKIESSYEQGSYKTESKMTAAARGDFKDESLANDETIRRIELELEEGPGGGGGGSVPPKNVVVPPSKALNQVGVFKHTSCGGYPELRVFMDNEDGRNISTVKGDGGAIRFDRNGNVTITFCIVPSNSFRRNAITDYAVLNVSGSLKHGVSRIDRLIDNEDSNNKNRTNLHTFTPWSNNEKEKVQRINGNYGLSNLGGRNTLLVFDYYKAGGQNTSPSVTSPLPFIPNLHKYGALGTFVIGSGTTGSLLTDDEDSRNANYLRVTEFNDATNKLNAQRSVGSIRHLIQGGGNTLFYISFR